MNNKDENAGLDHLFRHQHGKMVSVLVRRYGLNHLEAIEDAVQEAFITALRCWPQTYPDKPEAWLIRTASNKLLDSLRKNKRSQGADIPHVPGHDLQEELCLDTEVDDSQLRMIFTACNPELDRRDQISFALKTISGFSEKEIAAALLLKLPTVKKRIQRARTYVKESGMNFEIPVGRALAARLSLVHEVIYLIFIEGFHSSKKEWLIREDLCGEALRLCRMLLSHETVPNSESYALFALLCFHSARLKSKVNADYEIVSLKDQDRTLWYQPLIELGNRAMERAVDENTYTRFHLEAAIAYEHLRAPSYDSTNWERLQMWYEQLQHVHPSPLNILNLAVIHLQLKEFNLALQLLESVSPNVLEQRAYLYYGLMAEYFHHVDDDAEAVHYLEKAIKMATNNSEQAYLKKKLGQFQRRAR